MWSLNFHEPTRTGFPLGQGSPRKSGSLLEDQRKVRGENFYPCKFLTSIKKSYARRNVYSWIVYDNELHIWCLYLHLVLRWSYFGKGSKFWLPPLESGGEGIWKIKKRGWKYAGLLKKKEGWHFSYLIFSRFIIFTFTNYFTLCKIVFWIWWIFFFSHYDFMKKGHSKLYKNEPGNIP